MTNEQIAKVCHDSNRSYCQSIGDDSQLPWETAHDWQKQSAITGVKFSVENPNASDSAQHDSWTAEKVASGWTYGPVKDAELKEHHCIVPYDQLPIEQRRKDALFKAIVSALTKE